MAPILIDKRDLLKFGILSVLTIVLAFTGGFQFGYQQANMYSDFAAVAEIDQLSSPQGSAAKVSAIEQRSSEISNISENTDVAQVKPEIQSTEVKPAVVGAHTEAIMPEAVVSEQASLDKSAYKKRDEDELIVKEKVLFEKKPTAPMVTSDVPDGNNKIKYSIQVAVYGRLNNAENMMNTLRENNFDAYITDYTNKKKKVRFNVRFGHFKDRKTALSTLKDYMDNHKGDGYLVNYSVKNIVDVAKASLAIEEPLETPAVKEQPVEVVQPDNNSAAVSTSPTISDSTSVSVPVDTVPGNALQTGNTEALDDLKTAQGDSQIN